MKNIKKILSIFLIGIMMISCLTGCSGGDDVEQVDVNDPFYRIENEELIKPSQNSLFRYKIYDTYVEISEYVGEETNVVIPDTIEDKEVLVIGEQAFYNNSTVSTVVMSDKIVKVGNSAFGNCRALKSIVLSANLDAIPDYMFENCVALETVKITDNVRTIGTYSFMYCNSLEQIVIPSSVEEIRGNAFSSCQNLKKVTMMDGVIGDEESNYVRTVTKILGANVFAYCENLETVLIPDTVVQMEESALMNSSDNIVVYGYVPSEISRYCANQKIDFIEVIEGDAYDRQMKDRAIVVPESALNPEVEE
jgi:hypothetical protein